VKEKTEPAECESEGMTAACCQVRAMVTVDRKGQILLPKELRQEIGMKPGDKLLVLSVSPRGKPYSLILTKMDNVSSTIVIKVIDDLGKARGSFKKSD